MSDLCKQCALTIWGCDDGDLSTGEPMAALCEGCGWCNVDGEGRCLTHSHDELDRGASAANGAYPPGDDDSDCYDDNDGNSDAGPEPKS